MFKRLDLSAADPAYECSFYPVLWNCPVEKNRAMLCGVYLWPQDADRIHEIVLKRLPTYDDRDWWFWYPTGGAEQIQADVLWGYVRRV